MDDDTIASMEYAVEHLNVKFLCVLGHKGCAPWRLCIRPGKSHSTITCERCRIEYGIMPLVLKTQDRHSTDHLVWLPEKTPGNRPGLFMRRASLYATPFKKAKCSFCSGCTTWKPAASSFSTLNGNSDL